MDFKQALDGIRVVDFSIAGVGPLTTHHFADFGAEVIKVETSTRLDVMRRHGPWVGGPPDADTAVIFHRYNQNKRGIQLNLKRPEGVKLAKGLVKIADVVAENWTVRAIDNLGLGFEDLKKVKPDLIMIAMSLAGQTGPYQNFRGHGPVLAAMTGLYEVTGWPDKEPMSPGGALTDHFLPPVWVTAVMAALEYRNRTGKGQFIDASDFEAAIDLLGTAIMDYSANGHIQTRRGNSDPNASPHGVYRCQGDDRWCAITVFNEEQWLAFCRVLGNPPWTEEERFSTESRRREHTGELDCLIENWTQQRDALETVTILQEAGVPAGVSLDSAQVRDDPQLYHRGHFWDVEDPGARDFTYESSPCALSETPARFRRPAPSLGEANGYVYSELLGLSDREFARLVEEGVIE
jgi:benzylsuccinate CoA-transferase BbsF subunit